MRQTRIIRLTLGLFVISAMAFCIALTPRQALAQDPGYPAAAEKFSREELAQMLGPIALYPDKLLSQILMASTYPIEVIEADRWVKKNPGLQGDTLDTALLDEEWDPSVKAICHFPAILALMSERITETTKLGNAFLVQEAEVMNMVQELRAKAYAQGNLTTTPQQKVVVEQETIIIEPANPRIIYVPYYDPFYVYGPWWYPAYPPYYWGPPGVRVSLGVGMSFWPGAYFGFSFGDWSYFDWPRRYIYIHEHVRPRYVRHDHWYTKSGQWHHAPVHRRGVAYRDKFTATKYGQYPHRSDNFRSDIRGFPARNEPGQVNRRSGDERARMDRDRRGDDNSRYERSRQEQQRVEREMQKRQQQPRETTDRDRQQRQERTGIEHGPQERHRVEPPRQEMPRVENVPKDQPRVARPAQEQPTAERAPQERERVEQERQLRQRTDQWGRVREAVERELPQRNRENVFEQRENGRSERQSSERGRSSRQGWSDYSRDRGRGGDGHGGGREGGARNRR